MGQQAKVILGQGNLKVDLGSHVVLLYKDRSELLEILPNYYCEGLKNDDLK